MRAMPQAIEWSLATPITRPRLPFISAPFSVIYLSRSGTAREPPCFGYSRVVPLEYQRGIGAAEAETVRHGRPDLRVVDALAHDVGVGDGGTDLLDIGALGDEAVAHHQKRVDRLVHA